jgi:hypothetical protein
MTGLALATTAAALFAATPVTATAGAHASADDEATGKCVGGNACQGQSACATASTSCAGQNACKGEGWIKTTKAECDEAGGSFEPA